MDQNQGSSLNTVDESISNHIIQQGDFVLLKLPNGDVRSVKVDKDTTITLGRVGSFHANDLIDQPYGLAYEIVDKKLKILPPRSLDEVGTYAILCVSWIFIIGNHTEDTDATNELINDGQFVQPLTLEEIETLKQSGVHATDIIKKQIEQHANYSLKTEYSKEKYKKRKEAK